MKSNFDYIAPLYDFIAKIIYGKSIQEIQQVFLHRIPQNCRVLIIGGGTGWILHEIQKVSSPKEIVYVEKSSVMIEKTQKSIHNKKWINRITLVHGTIESLDLDNTFDIVITHFFLDMFTEGKLKNIIIDLNKRLSIDGKWFYCDFYNTGKVIHRILLWIMYRFFKIVANIEVMTLEDPIPHFNQLQYKKSDEKTVCNGFMKSIMWTKQ